MKNYEFALTGSSGQLLAYGQTQDIEDKGLQQVVQAVCEDTTDNFGGRAYLDCQKTMDFYAAEADIHTCQTGR